MTFVSHKSIRCREIKNTYLSRFLSLPSFLFQVRTLSKIACSWYICLISTGQNYTGKKAHDCAGYCWLCPKAQGFQAQTLVMSLANYDEAHAGVRHDGPASAHQWLSSCCRTRSLQPHARCPQAASCHQSPSIGSSTQAVSGGRRVLG